MDEDEIDAILAALGLVVPDVESNSEDGEAPASFDDIGDWND